MMKKLLLASIVALFPTAAFANCNPTPILDGGGNSTNTKTASDGSSNCFGFVGLVDGSGAAAFPNVGALADSTANPTVFLSGSLLEGFNGTTWDRLRTVGTGILKSDMSTVGGTAVVTGGANGLQAVAGPVASGGSNADNPLKVGGVFNTTQPTVTNGQIVDLQATARGAAIVAPGVDNFAVQAAQSGTWTVQPGNTPNTSAWLMQPVPGTSGGASTCYLATAATTNSTNCKGSAGQIYHMHLENTTATVVYLRTYNASSAPTCSSATGYIETIPIPANTAVGGIVMDISVGQAFSTGIGFCVTGGSASTDNTNAVVGAFVTILYK